MERKLTFRADIEALAAIADAAALTAGIIGLIFGRRKAKVVSGIFCFISVAAGALLFARHFGLFGKPKKKLSLDLDLDSDGDGDLDLDLEAEDGLAREDITVETVSEALDD